MVKVWLLITSLFKKLNDQLDLDFTLLAIRPAAKQAPKSLAVHGA